MRTCEVVVAEEPGVLDDEVDAPEKSAVLCGGLDSASPKSCGLDATSSKSMLRGRAGEPRGEALLQLDEELVACGREGGSGDA